MRLRGKKRRNLSVIKAFLGGHPVRIELTKCNLLQLLTLTFEDDFAIEVAEIKDDLNNDGAYDVPVKDVDDIYLYGESGDDIYLTLGAVFNYLEIDKDSQEEIGGFFSDNVTSYTLDNWARFGLDDIESVFFEIEKEYIKENSSFLSSNLTDNESEALTVSSVLQHMEPTVTTINQQVSSGFSQSLPIDNPRFTTFQDPIRYCSIPKTKTSY